MTKGRVIVAMSGGVDSSVAALLLKRQGYDVVGVTMRLWTVERDDLPAASKRCCSVEDVDDARRVCQTIGVPHYVMNFEREFEEHVVDYFCREYDRGRTPHPCLACNDKIKFDFLLRRALFLDAEYVATGHYARVQARPGGVRAPQGNRLPEGPVLRAVHADAERAWLGCSFRWVSTPRAACASWPQRPGSPSPTSPTARRSASSPTATTASSSVAAPAPGRETSSTRAGKCLVRIRGYSSSPWGRGAGSASGETPALLKYVVRIDAARNRVVLGAEDDLYSTSMWASSVNFPRGIAPGIPVEVTAKIRYKASEAPATLTPHDGFAEIRFHEPQRAVTPGQAVVFYNGDRLLGGGIIELEPPAAAAVPEALAEAAAG